MNASAGGASGAAAAAEPDTPGGMLHAERERRGYSMQQVAEDLHLDVWVIEALEANRFLALGAPVYAKGHLRKYAMLLSLSPATVLERYQTLSGTPAEPTPVPVAIAAPIRAERRRLLKLPLLIVAAIAVAAGLAWLVYELLPLRGSDDSTTSDVPAATVQPAPMAQTAVPAPAPAAAAANEVRLRLQFSEASWTEIYDATGRRLMFDLGTPGRVRTVAGTPPLRVNLGLASAVSVQVDERPIVIPRRAGRNDARFRIEADGSVRPDSAVQTAGRIE